jgi:lambda family phage tail tape measure protein
METDWTSQTSALGDARDRLIELDGLANKFGVSMNRAFASGIASGKSFDDILRNVGQKFIELSLRSALQPATNLIGGLFSQLTSGLTGAIGGSLGINAGPVMPFADGGVIASPGYFPLGRGVGLAGEAGPEAILPLSRGSDGRLGVAASGTAGATPVYVTIQTQDVESFSRSEAQVSAMLARAVARGRRGM